LTLSQVCDILSGKRVSGYFGTPKEVTHNNHIATETEEEFTSLTTESKHEYRPEYRPEHLEIQPSVGPPYPHRSVGVWGMGFVLLQRGSEAGDGGDRHEHSAGRGDQHPGTGHRFVAACGDN